MIRQHINQYDLAEGIESSQPIISKYLSGQSIPSAIVLKKISEVLHCDMIDFFK